MVRRIKRERTKGWRQPEGAVFVGFRTVWGNPFKIGEPSGFGFNDGGDETPMIAAMTSEQVVSFYRDLVRGFLCPEMHPHGHHWMREFKRRMNGGHPSEMAIAYLRGRDLVCWCSLHDDCHADVLLELANTPTGGTNDRS